MDQNKILKIGISSILCYLIFKKSYSILTSILLWINLELRSENEILWIALNIISGVLAFLVLGFIYNRFLKNKIPEKSDVLILLSVTIILTLIVTAINWLFGNYVVEIKLDAYRTKYLFQLGWSKGMDAIFPIFALIYFMWKLYTDKITASNNA